MAMNKGDARGHVGDSKAENSDSYAGKFNIPYSRAAMKNDSSESIGAGDVGNMTSSSNDASPDDLGMPCPSKK